MKKSKYSPEKEKLTLVEFGEELLKLEDLDPVYPVLRPYAIADRERARRAVLAYALFYDIGVALYLASQKDFWSVVRIAAVNEEATPHGTRWPRAAERRHFRGEKCVRAVDELRKAFPAPEGLVETLIEPGGELKFVIHRLSVLPQFGPWIAFKLADIGERVLEAPIVFPQGLDNSLYSSPLATVRSLAEAEGVRLEVIWDRALAHFAVFSAPPRHERGCGAAEIETVFCKYGSYLKGHYYPGKDVKEVSHSLKLWDYKAAQVNDDERGR
jgi:hypothetical protein